MMLKFSRAKRRERDNARKAQSRRWYYEKADWIVSDEIEDEELDLSEEEVWVFCYGFFRRSYISSGVISRFSALSKNTRKYLQIIIIKFSCVLLEMNH